MVSVLLIVLVMTMMVLSSSFPLRISSQMKRINSKMYMNEFARNEPPTKTASDEEIKETKDLIIKKEVEEQEEITKSMRDKLLKEIRDGGGDPNYSKGAVAGNPILLISFVVAALAVASYAIGAL